MQSKVTATDKPNFTEYVRSICGPLILDYFDDHSAEQNSLEIAEIGTVRLSRLRMGPHSMRAERRHSHADSGAAIKLLFQVEGEQTLRTQSGDYHLKRGDWTMFDPAYDYQTHCSTAITQILIEIPRAHIQAQVLGKLDQPQIFSGSFFSRPTVLLAHEALSLPPACAASICEQMQAAIAAMTRSLQSLVDERIGQTARPDQLLRDRFKAYVSLRLHDPLLSIDEVAQKLGCSRRRLYAVFETTERSPAEVIRDMRLEHAHERLHQPQALRPQIATIAYQYGFQSAAHFTRAYKQRYGITPTALRRGPAPA